MRSFQVVATCVVVFAARTVEGAPAAACGSFDAWRTTHGKAYASTAAATKAEAAFTRNCQRFERLNSVPGGARFEADEHADLAPTEFAARFGGCYIEDAVGAVEPKVAPESISYTAASGKRPSVDWRTKGQVTHVKNQGAFGTCWSFGVAENLEGLNVRQGHALVNISEQEFISCCKECQGSRADTTFDWLMNNTHGRPALEATYPYVGKPGKCLAATAPKAPVQLHSWGRVQDDGTGMPVAAGLVQHGPLGMGVDATCFHGYKSGVIRNCTSKGVDHAVLMVAAGTDQGVNYFTIKNSWGAKWGEEGYVRIEQGKVWWGPLSMIFTE